MLERSEVFVYKERKTMKKKTSLIGVLALIVLAVTGTAMAQGVSEHPLVRPFPGAVLDERRSEQFNFGESDFRVGTDRESTVQNVRGEYRKLRYVLYNQDGSPNRNVSQLEYFENYKAAALGKGGEIKSEHRSHGLVFTIPREDGGVTWVRVTTTVSNGSNDLIIVDEKALETVLNFGTAEMKAALDADGKIALYGILFDYDKATLQQASNKELQDVLSMLSDHPDLRVEIQGHTDSDGSPAYNLQLSEQRAESVLNYLVLFGIDAARLESKGYGESMPVAPNDTAENKAKNRRVELVRLD